MNALRRRSGLLPNIVIAILLLAAQSIAIAHRFDHDPGLVQNKACAACAVASHMSATGIDQAPFDIATRPAMVTTSYALHPAAPPRPVHIRQRGPPPTP